VLKVPSVEAARIFAPLSVPFGHASAGYPSMLRPISSQLFEHLASLFEIASESPIKGPVLSKYDDILGHLAKQPAYVEAAQLHDIEKLVQIQALRLKSKYGTTATDKDMTFPGEDGNILSNLSHLIKYASAEISSHLVLMLADILNSLGSTFPSIEARVPTKIAFYELVNIFLKTFGRDVSHQCSSLLKALHVPTMQALNSNNNALKDVAAEYLHLQLVVGVFGPLLIAKSDEGKFILDGIFSWVLQQTKSSKNW
jgi:hypothetical protein